jgi:SAM-dependent methyltransferase
MTSFLPSIWMGDFQSKIEYENKSSHLAEAYSVYDWLDDRVLHSRHGFSYPAYCSACGHVTKMLVDWTFGGFGTSSSVNPAWTETAKCEECGLNSRMRAVIDFLKTHCDLDGLPQTYVSEQITLSYRILKGILPKLVGSEYLGPDLPGGKIINQWGKARRVRHEDLTALSFSDGQFELAITQDVFEHIPNYKKAFSELHRILRPNGQLVFTIPFFFDLETPRIRASLGSEGVIHHYPAEFHGNPISEEGSLCFQNFGWDILSDLRQVGFNESLAHMYWGPWQGHLGYPFFVFSASKTETPQ